MQADANDLDVQRSSRLKAIELEDQARREAEEKARERSSKYGGRGDFVHSLNKKAGEMELGDRIKRARGGLEKSLNNE